MWFPCTAGSVYPGRLASWLSSELGAVIGRSPAALPLPLPGGARRPLQPCWQQFCAAGQRAQLRFCSCDLAMPTEH